MPITHSSYNDNLIIAVTGRMDARFIQEQREVLEKLPKQIDSDVLFDLSSADFIDSSGIGFLVYLYKRLKPQNYALTILGLNGQPLDTVKMLRIDRMINCVNTLADFDRKTNKKGGKREALKNLVSRKRFVKRATN